ncbi:uncharacterized protein LOC126894388 [Daktulosphaira vitifoliae]|uniref:uncharacterized protein LOC126894388 n=1 Tax=Daktulosphaira vitifoliae TaxID=58002 RepID=UPI0021AA9AD8|nr:uncharacterized protein LOC126894388 [Daktulosphaira vitifoliae]
MDKIQRDTYFPNTNSSRNSRSKNVDAESMIRNIISQDTFIINKDQELYSKLPKWMVPKSGFVHPLYEQIWQYVKTDKRDRSCDTNLVSELLITSGLSVDVLGKLWSMSNIGIEGSLSQQELYIILALVTLVQNGYSVSNISLLQHIQKPIIPQLNYALIEKKNTPTGKNFIGGQTQLLDSKYKLPKLNNDNDLVKNTQQSNFGMIPSDEYNDPLEVTFLEPKSYDTKIIPLSISSLQPKSLDLTPINNSFDTFDDEFSDFQSAQFNNASDYTIQENKDPYEFTEFQSAFDQISDDKNVKKVEQNVLLDDQLNFTNENQQDLINCQDIHDKYEIFRTLVAESEDVSGIINENNQEDSFTFTNSNNHNIVNDNFEHDEFGDFLGVKQFPCSKEANINSYWHDVQVQCINKCLEIINEGYVILSSVSHEHILMEVLNHKKGIQYIEQLNLVSKICHRLLKNFSSSSLNDKLHETVSKLEKYFNSIDCNTANDFEVSDSSDKSLICHLCKCKCQTNVVNYMLQNYHSSCINLLVNFVQNS